MTTTITSPAEKTETATPPRRRWGRRLIGMALFLGVLFLCRAPILQFLGGLLVKNDELTATDAAVIMGRSGPYRAVPVDEVAELYNKGQVKQILLIEDRSSRIVKAGIVPTLESVMTAEFVKREIPTTILTTLAADYSRGSEMWSALSGWLIEHPDAHVTVVCDQFYSRGNACHAGNILLASEFARVHWHAVPDKRYDVSNWWHTRFGVLEVVGASISLLHAYIIGETTEAASPWNADDYERRLAERTAP
jgi:hypothetical protein